MSDRHHAYAPIKPSVACRRLVLQRFSTEADVDLGGLRLRVADRALTAPARAARRGTVVDARPGIGSWWRRKLREASDRVKRWTRRIWDDLTQRDDIGVRRQGTDEAEKRTLNARHCRVGGVLLLPRHDAAIDYADLSFASADRVEIPGRCLRNSCAPLSLDLNSARAESAKLIEPLPSRVDVRDAEVGHWDVGGDQVTTRADEADDGEDKYLKFAQLSWPFAQAVYTRLEQDYRDAGKHREADRFLAAMGWRLWRWSFLRPMFELAQQHADARSPAPDAGGQSASGVLLSWPWFAVAVPLLVAITVASLFASTLVEGFVWFYASLLVFGATLALLSFVDLCKRASRFVLGLAAVGPAQLVFGFGIRWWLPLLVSVVAMVLVTLPVMSDCRNLVPSTGAGAAMPNQALAMSPPRRSSLWAVMGAEANWWPYVVSDCKLTGPQAHEDQRWTMGEAFWMAMRYHVPVIGIDSFFHGERSESLRPSEGALHLISLGDRRVESVSPIGYARSIYLLSWALIPFSLIFLAARIQRKYRLQK